MTVPSEAPALGTTFAQRRREAEEGPLSPEGILDEAQAAGAGGLVLCDGLPGELLAPLARALARDEGLPAVAIDGQLGAGWLGRPRLCAAALGSLDRDEGRAAAERTLAALELAEACGAAAVFVGFGPVPAVASRWEGLRRRFLRGELAQDEAPAERLMEERGAAAAAHLAGALRALEPVVAAAARRGLLILVKNPRRGLDLPAPVELRVLLAELHGAPVAPLLDLPAAHLSSAMRLVPLRETITTFAPGPLALLGDACGAVGALAPGQGEVDVAAVARYLPRDAGIGFAPWAGLRLPEVRQGLERLAALPRRKEA